IFLRSEGNQMPDRYTSYRSTVGGPFACYLEQPSTTPPAAPALTLDPSISCSLFALFFRLLSFVFSHLQRLLPKNEGWGIPLHLAPVESATYRLFFPPSHNLVNTILAEPSF